MKTEILAIGTRVKADAAFYGIKEATITAIDWDVNGKEFYRLDWRNTAWSEGGTFVYREEIIEILPKEA